MFLLSHKSFGSFSLECQPLPLGPLLPQTLPEVSNQGWLASPSGSSTTQFSPQEIEDRGAGAQGQESGRLEPSKEKEKEELERKQRTGLSMSSHKVLTEALTGHVFPDTVPRTLYGLACHCHPMKHYFYPDCTDKQTDSQRKHTACSS